ncbi:hypothetical protein LINPERHAP2_LOCUS37646 [Linum perenne]
MKIGPQEISQVEEEKLECEQLLGLFWEHLFAILGAITCTSYAADSSLDSWSLKQREGAPRKTTSTYF